MNGEQLKLLGEAMTDLIRRPPKPVWHARRGVIGWEVVDDTGRVIVHGLKKKYAVEAAARGSLV